MRVTKRFLLKTGVGTLAGLTLYLALLCFPGSLFGWSAHSGNLTLYSDRPFSTEAGTSVLKLVQAKLSSSPLYSAQQPHAAFICNTRWRRLLFFQRHYSVAGGLNYYPLTSNIFLREASIEENRLMSTDDILISGARTLDYFIAHEMTHTTVTRAVGIVRHLRMSEWVREGYADYVAKGNAFNYDEARRAFLGGAPEMDRQKSGLYLRYHLLVAYLLDKKKWSVQKLLEDSIAQSAVERELATATSVASVSREVAK